MLTYFLQIWEVWFILPGFPDILWSLLAKSHPNEDLNSYLVWWLFYDPAVYRGWLPFLGCPIHDFKAFPCFSPLVENVIIRDTLDSICYSYTVGIMPIHREVVAFILLSRPEKFQSKLKKNFNSEAWSTIGRWDTRLGIKKCKCDRIGVWVGRILTKSRAITSAGFLGKS